jgi:tetratricopeptide (TPR) repeat protein
LPGCLCWNIPGLLVTVLESKLIETMIPTSPSPQPSRCGPALWISLVLAAGTLLVYWPVTKFQFVSYDDTDFVTANPHVQAGLTFEGFKWVWHSEVARNWHPMTMLTHMLDCQMFGLNAGGHHLVNVLFHIANAVLLFHLLRLMTAVVWRSAFVAALFAWHPLHVESVAWIAERKDVLSAFFWFLTMWTYVRYVRELGAQNSKFKLYYALALLFFALGLMSKPMLVTVPFVLLLLDFWPLARLKPLQTAAKAPPESRKRKAQAIPAVAAGKKIFPGRLLWEKVPFLVMSAGLCVVTYSIQKHGGAMLTGRDLPVASRIENALISYLRYIEKMFWPDHLAGLYLRSGGWPLWLAVLAAVALLIVTIFVVRQRRERPWLAMGWLWYLGTLVPVLGLVQVGMQSMADRFTYVPLVGLFIIVSWGGCELARSMRLPDFALWAAAILALTVCMGLSARQIGYWKDSETLFNRMIAATPNNYMAHYNIANIYSRAGKVDEAAAHYKAALQEEPKYADAHNNFAGLLLEQKRYDEAIEHYSAAIRINPQYIYYFNLANALADAASARHDTNEFAEAVRTYGQALQLDPGACDAHNNLGMTWDAQGREHEAAAEFSEAVRLKPGFELAHFNLANAFSRLGKLEEAIAEYRVAAQLNPDRAETHNGLGIAYAMQNKMNAAAQEFKEVVRLQPDNAAASGNLGNALASENRIDESIPYYLAALRLNPADYQTEFNLGLSLSRRGDRAGAESHYRQALRLKPDYGEAQRALRELEKAVNNKQ